MISPLPTSLRLLLTLALLLPTILPALAPAPATSALSSTSTFTSPLPPPAPRPAARLALIVLADPTWAEPGEVVTFTVTAANPGPTPLTDLTLTDALPEGLIYVAGSAVGFVYAASEKQLTWQPAAVAAGATITGSFQARVQGLALGDTVTNTVTASAAGLATPVRTNAAVEVVSPRANEAWITPEQGGLLRAPDDRALLRVPPGAVRGRTRFTYAPATDVPNPPPGLRFAFRLEAADAQGWAVREFPTALALTIVHGITTEGQRPTLFYFNEMSGHWQAIPVTSADRQRAHAQLDHLTLLAVGAGSGKLEIEPAAQIRGAQATLFSRSIAYQYLFDLPPGQGGLVPRLGLAYVSANHNLEAGHFSPVGHGWQLLGADYVERRPNPVNGTWYDVSLYLQGQTYTLVRADPREGFPTGRWYAKEDPTLKVAYEETDLPEAKYRVFKIWTPDGTLYQFQGNVHVNGTGADNGSKALPPATYKWPEAGGQVACSGPPAEWVRLPLHEVTDTRNNVIHYSWTPEGSWEVGAYPASPGHPGDSKKYDDSCWYVRALRLAEISYNGVAALGSPSDTIKITFDYGAATERKDRPQFFEQKEVCDPYCVPIYSYFSIYRLKSATLAARAYNSAAWSAIRTVTLAHAGQDSASPAQQVLQLDAITEAAGGLARTTGLAYVNGMIWQSHYGYLRQVTNPLGGSVTFTTTDNGNAQSGQSLPKIVTTRSETDAVTGQSATWTYDSAGWHKDARGYERVWVTQPDTAVAVHNFEQLPCETQGDNAWCYKAGRETKTRLCTSYNGTADICTGEQQRTVIVNAAEQLPSGLSVGAFDRPWFIYTQEVQTLAPDAAGQLVARQKTRYAYEPARQAGTAGAKQYGNLTRVEEYEGVGGLSFASAPLRTTTTRYYPNDSQWLVNQPAVTQVYTGTTTLFAETRNYYDNTTNYTAPPTAGLRKRVDTLSVFNGAYQGNPASVSQYFEHENGNLKWVQDANGNTTTYFYDPWYKAFRVCEQNAANQKTKTTYYGVPGDGVCNTTNGSALTTPGAAFGQIEQVADANGMMDRTAYDGLGRPQTVTRAAGTADQTQQSYSYLPFDDPASSTDDPGRLEAGQVFWVHAQQQDNAGGDNYLHTWTFYDGFGRAIETQAEVDNNQHIETYHSYTFRDAPARDSPPLLKPGSVTSSASYTPIPAWTNQNSTLYLYDKLGRPTTVTYPDSTSQTTTYVAEGRSTGVRSITTATDERGRQQQTAQDAFGRLRASSVYSGTTPVSASYDYNVADQLTTVTAPGGFVTTIGYDGLGRKASVSDPDLGLWQYTYDAAGNLATQTDARGITLWFKYDSLNRLTEKRQTDATGPLLAQYVYDEAQTGYANLGRRTRATAYEYRDSWGSSATLTNTLTQNYDARGRVKAATRTVDGANYTTQYAYDPADRRIRITYPDGEQATTAYGSQGQPISLSSTLGGTLAERTLADNAGYDEANRLRSLRFPAGGNLVRRQVYYPWTQQRGRLQSLLVGTSATTADRLNLIYSYDAVGNVQSISDNGVQSSFGYDGLYQLTSAYGQSFSYDTASRLVNYNGLIYTPDAAHPHAVDKVANVDRYDYDANGNQVVRNKGVVNQEQVLAWDAENRLNSVTYTNLASAGGGGGPPSTLPKRVFLPLIMQQQPVECYSYDADGGRVRKESKSEITRIIGPHYEVVVAVASGQVLTTTKYYQFGGQRIAVRQNGTLSYLHGDHLGSISVATSASGAKTSDARYFAYGGQRSGNLFALPTDHTFTGQKLDRGTGLLYYGARYYDSALGMFVSPDPLIPNPDNPQDLNRYGYTRNNPLKYIDSDGHFAFVPLLIAGGVGALATSALDLGKQLVVDQKSIQDVNWAEVGGAAVGGFVSGATLGLAPAGASVIGLGLLGAAGGVAGSQAQALTQAGLEDLLGKNP